jgi:hypothetical protein
VKYPVWASKVDGFHKTSNLDVYNVFLQTDNFPDMMKKAKIKPLFEKGNREDVKNS